MNIDDFGKIIDAHLREIDVRMRVKLPVGSLSAEIQTNINGGPVIELYIAIHALRAALDNVLRLEEFDETKRAELLDGILEMVKGDILEDGEEADTLR